MMKIRSFIQSFSFKKYAAFISVLCYILIYAAIIFPIWPENSGIFSWYWKTYILFFSSILFVLSLGKISSSNAEVMKGSDSKSMDLASTSAEKKQEAQEELNLSSQN